MKIIGSLFAVAGGIMVISFPVLILLAIWLPPPHGGFPRGQLIGSAFIDVVCGGILCGVGLDMMGEI